MLVKNRLKLKAAVVLAMTTFACGQNASVTRPGEDVAAAGVKGALTNPGSGEDAHTTPEAGVTGPTGSASLDPVGASGPTGSSGPSGSTASTGNTGPTGAVAVTGPAAVVGATGANGMNGRDGTNTVTVIYVNTPTAPAAAPAPAAPVAGPAGANGLNGANGLSACGIEDRTATINAVPMLPREYRVAQLPYRSTQRHAIRVRQIGQSNHVTSAGIHYVRDSQILFKFPVHLAPQEAIHHISSAYIQMSVTKLSSDGHPDTEWMCFLGQKICSGKVFDERSWQGNINMNFWNHLNGEAGDAFVTQLHTDQQVGRFGGQTLWSSEAFTLRIEDLIHNSNFADAKAFLYDGVAANARLESDLKVAIADDTYVKSAKLVIEYQENTCRTQELVTSAAHRR